MTGFDNTLLFYNFSASFADNTSLKQFLQNIA